MKQSNIFKRLIIAAGVLASVAFYIFESAGGSGSRHGSDGLVFENGDRPADGFVFDGGDSCYGNNPQDQGAGSSSERKGSGTGSGSVSQGAGSGTVSGGNASQGVGSVSQDLSAIKVSELSVDELKTLITLTVEKAIEETLENRMQEASEGAFGEALRNAVRDEIIKAGEEGYLDEALNRSVEAAEKKSLLVNINTADKNELMTLEGVGEKRASDIISYREQNGGFNSIDELMNVSGIKEAMYEKIRDKITV